ncbi:hypothetical protein EMEDMD4_940046 [Sinorhizobium medicae]|uniref:Uncharacterized protein n=1 Tax=Sinorhizobium medicae TaxID=110321 RepID=A0A508X8C5_9HYPH|nr:hypothetical protein EMEDMD4_940046 [Sinorhizobium medicae]
MGAGTIALMIDIPLPLDAEHASFLAKIHCTMVSASVSTCFHDTIVQWHTPRHLSMLMRSIERGSSVQRAGLCSPDRTRRRTS